MYFFDYWSYCYYHHYHYWCSCCSLWLVLPIIVTIIIIILIAIINVWSIMLIIRSCTCWHSNHIVNVAQNQINSSHYIDVKKKHSPPSKRLLKGPPFFFRFGLPPQPRMQSSLKEGFLGRIPEPKTGSDILGGDWNPTWRVRYVPTSRASWPFHTPNLANPWGPGRAQLGAPQQMQESPWRDLKLLAVLPGGAAAVWGLRGLELQNSPKMEVFTAFFRG